MKRLFTLIVAFALYTSLYGQNDTVYHLTYGGIQNDVCNQIKPTYDGGYIMIGTSNSFGCGNTDFYAVKIDSLGKHEWSRTYGGTENEEGFSVTPTFDHGYAFVGFTDSYGNGGYDVLLVKTDSMGNFQWQRTYGGSDWDFGYSVQQLSDSGFVICGQTYSFGAGNGDVYIIRTDKNGDTLWTRAIGGSGYDVGNAVCVEEDSLYAIAGNTTSFGLGDTNVCFILMNNKGSIKKDTTYGCTHTTIGNSISETMNHGYIIYGSSDSTNPGILNEMMIQIDSLGKVDTIPIYYSPETGIGKDAIQAPDGSYLTVGSNNSYGVGGYAMHVQHLAPAGWFMGGSDHGGTADQQGNSIAIGKNGNVVFAGASDSPGFTEGLYDIMAVRWKSDTIVEVYPISIKNFYDTCDCTLGIALQSTIHPEVKIFPNPVSSSSTILVQGDIGSYYFFNVFNSSGDCIIQGSPLQAANHGQSIGHFEKGNLAAGVYIYEVFNQGNIKVATGKLIVD